MVALNDLHRRLHSRDNKGLIEREKSPDDYDTEKITRNPREDVLEENSLDPSPKPVESVSDLNQPVNKPVVPSDEKKTEIGNPLTDLEDSSGKGGFRDYFSKNRDRFKTIGSVVAALVIIIGGAVAYIKYKQTAFNQENVLVQIQGSNEIVSGGELACQLVITNKNRVDLKNIVLKLDYPSELIPEKKSFMEKVSLEDFYIQVGSLGASESKNYELKFNVYSPFGGQIYLKTETSYQPSGFSTQFTKIDNHSFDIQGSEISFSLVTQQEASSGELLKFIGVLTNNTVKNYDNLILEMNYPDGFSFASSELEKIGNSQARFKIPTLNAGQKMEVSLLGSFSGQTDSIKNITGTIGFLGENDNFSKIVSSEESVKLVPSKVLITQEVVSGLAGDGLITEAGSVLKYVINFKNNSSSPLLDLILKEELDGDLIDTSSIKLPAGYYDEANKEIVWKASEVPALKVLNPGEGGSVEFQYKVRPDFVPGGDSSNQTLSTRAKISSLNINSALLNNKEISSETKNVRLKTKLDLILSGSHSGGE